VLDITGESGSFQARKIIVSNIIYAKLTTEIQYVWIFPVELNPVISVFFEKLVLF